MQFNYLEEGVEWMFLGSIHVNFHRQFKVGFEAAAWSDILQTVQNFGSVGARFLLYIDNIDIPAITYSVSQPPPPRFSDIFFTTFESL